MGCIFRWAGSKERIRHQILEKIGPRKRRRWLAPFCGACHVEFEAMRRGLAEEFVLADKLPDLVAVLDTIQHRHGWLAGQLDMILEEDIKTQEREFYKERAAVHILPECVALRFLRLQTCGWNGVWRVSARSGYNVKFGRPASFDFEALVEARDLLRRVKPKLLCQDFEQTIASAGEGDIVYADCPYLGQHSTYTAEGFTEADHVRLAAALLFAKERGAECWVSNSDTAATRDIYRGTIHEISARRSVSCKATTRGEKIELLIQL